MTLQHGKSEELGRFDGQQDEDQQHVCTIICIRMAHAEAHTSPLARLIVNELVPVSARDGRIGG